MAVTEKILQPDEPRQPTRLRRFHAHQPGPAGSAVELLRELRDQEP
jgi:hypothetical protein